MNNIVFLFITYEYNCRHDDLLEKTKRNAFNSAHYKVAKSLDECQSFIMSQKHLKS